MRLVGLETLYPKRRTSLPHPAHRRFPYLLRNLVIERPNQVWVADVTYVPMRRGFLYLVAIIDWASRAVLSWRLSTTMEAHCCVEALNEAIPCLRPERALRNTLSSTIMYAVISPSYRRAPWQVYTASTLVEAA